MNNYVGDFAVGADIYLTFDTADSTGASVTATVVVADIEVYRQNTGAIGLTQHSSTAGFTLDVDHDAMTGTHMVAIDTSDDTDAGFFAAGYDYFVKLNTVTVDGVSISKWIGHFGIQNRYAKLPADWEDGGRLDLILDSRMAESSINTTGGAVDLVSTTTNVTNLASGTAGISIQAASFVNTAGGTETNSYTDTYALDGTTHDVAPNAGSTDGYYEFNIGGNGIPLAVDWEGYANSNGDSYVVEGYDYGTTSYVQIGTIPGSNVTTPGIETFLYPGGLVGSGADSGKVRFRITSSDGTNLSTDRVLLEYTISNASSGYVAIISP